MKHIRRIYFVATPRRKRALLAFLVFLAVYISGVIARDRYPLLVVIHNESGETLRNVSVKVDYKGNLYPLRDMSPGETRHAFVQPVGESTINLKFRDVRNIDHIEMLAEDVKNDRGTATVTVLPGGRVGVEDDVLRFFQWKSWFAFIW
jgi:hypothetical protein